MFQQTHLFAKNALGSFCCHFLWEKSLSSEKADQKREQTDSLKLQGVQLPTHQPAVPFWPHFLIIKNVAFILLSFLCSFQRRRSFVRVQRTVLRVRGWGVWERKWYLWLLMKELFCLWRHLFRPTWPRRHQEKVLEHWKGKWGACVCRGKVGLRTRSCIRAPPLQSLYLCKCTETQARDILKSAHCSWQYYAWNRGKLICLFL